MKIEDVEIGISPITGTVYVGVTSKDKLGWKCKKDVTGQFIAVMLEKFKPEDLHTITESGKPVFEIQIKAVKDE